MKRYKQVLTVAACMAVLLSVCGGKQDFSMPEFKVREETSAEEASASEASTQEEAPDTDEVLNPVCDRWSEKGSFNVRAANGDIWPFKYDFQVPLLQEETEDARKINQEIADKFEGAYQLIESAKNADSIDSEALYEYEALYWVSYEAYINEGHILTIKICNSFNPDDFEWREYTIFNYDLSTGRRMSNEELLAAWNIPKESFVEDIRRAAMYATDREIAGYFEFEAAIPEDLPLGEVYYPDYPESDVLSTYINLLSLRAKTISMDNINIDMPIAPGTDGDMAAYVKVPDMLQIGYHIEELVPNRWVNYGFSRDDGESVYVESADDGIYITLIRTEWLGRTFDNTPVEYGKRYKLDGIYKNYLDAEIFFPGNGLVPYVVLLCDDGTVSYVDVHAGVMTGYFSVIEPMFGFCEMRSFVREEESVTLLQDANGKLVSVSERLYHSDGIGYEGMEMQLLDMDFVSRYATVITHQTPGEEGLQTEVSIEEGAHSYPVLVERWAALSGGAYTEMNEEQQNNFMLFKGMNEKGILYATQFTTAGGDYLTGMAAIRTWQEEGEEGERARVGLFCTQLTGFDIWESGGEEVVMQGTLMPLPGQ